ncbi:MAG: Crp/Fnr family transcriptional regulator [Acidobacteriaceae bacterium]|nr:Crp/Fnr family transcriptional regulator [Acidobacteriaceae bacterium]
MSSQAIPSAVLALEQELSVYHSSPERSYGPAVRLVRQGFPIERVWVVTRGTIKLSFLDPYGRESILSLRPAPCIIGAAGAILNAPSLVTATTLTEVVVRQVSANDLRHSLKNNPELAYHISCAIAAEYTQQTGAMMEAGSLNTRKRLLELLQQRMSAGANGSAESGNCSHPAALLKKHEIAKLLAVTPEHLSRLLRAMQREGLLRRDKGRIVLQEKQVSADSKPKASANAAR